MDQERIDPDARPWINPVGGIGDMLMVSGVLKQIVDRDPSRRFNLVRRTRYLSVFGEHAAIDQVGHPPKGAPMLHTTYWSMEKLGGGDQRPFQILARHFGLPTPAREDLYLPGAAPADELLYRTLPWKAVNVVIAPASDSPRKALPPATWHQLVERLAADGAFVMQVGLARDLRIRNCYSLLGLTTPQQLVGLLKRCHLVVTVDNFVMHAAHYAQVPTVAMWGPTHHEVYGYPGQRHLQAELHCGYAPGGSCIVSEENRNGSVYGTECPHGQAHCMNAFSAEQIHVVCRQQLG